MALKMPNINQVALSGTVLSEPVADFDVEGQEDCLSFTLSNVRAFRDEEDQWQSETTEFPIKLHGNVARSFANLIDEGDPLFITGRLHNRPDDLMHVRSIQILNKKE